MKSILVVLVTLFFNSNIMAESTMQKEITDHFSDKVKDIKVVDDHLEISFSRHAAIYRLNKSHPKFVELEKLLNEHKKTQKKITITSALPKMEIKEIAE